MMAEIVISIVAKVAEYMVEPVLRQGKYFLCINKVIKDVENEKKELESKRDSLLDHVEQAKERTEVIEKPVEKWLNDVENLLKEVAELEQRMRTNDTCFQGWCPTWGRYRLCKKFVKKIRVMEKFISRSNIQPFSHYAPLPGIWYESSDNFTYFESTKVACNELLTALRDDSVYMIGVHGMGGSGKTTLVTEVGKKVEGLNLFDKVISITVSQTPNIRSIQGRIADMLSLELKEESEEGRAQRIWLSLKEKKKVLIIVDDIWGQFQLKDVGIYLDNDCKNRWKILVTTRDQHVCDLMGCQKRIHLSLLSEDESWTLFQKHASVDDAFSQSLSGLPWEVCKECKGLPIAIVTVGSSLKRPEERKAKCNAEWQVALDSLRHSEAIDDHVHEGVGAALNCLKLSYDYLKNKEAELLFLMCSMFPEDYEVSVEDVIRYAVGLGLGGRLLLESARSRIETGMNKLLDSCLLNYVGETKDHVKMHDMVRDVALWIAKRSEDHKILVNLDKPFATLVEDYGIREYFAVSSWYKQENQIFLQCDAPNLEVLLLNTDGWHSLNLSCTIFEGMKNLKVFSAISKAFSGRQPLSLPQSIQLFTNLRTLRLNGWHLGDISIIASLTTLEVLDLRRCNLDNLPNQIGKLKRLKLLDLSCCHFLQKNYNGAIGKFSQLEELYMSKCHPKEYLCQSAMDVVSLPKLQRFVIHTSSFTMTENTKGMIRVLELVDFNVSNLGASRKNILQIAEMVCLQRLRGTSKNIIPDVIGGMDDLIHLRLQGCIGIECIFNATSDVLIPRLVGLELSGMKNLKELCRGTPLQVVHFFETLEKLFIGYCPQLHDIFPRKCNLQNLKILTVKNSYYASCMAGELLFSMSVAQSLKQLEELTIDGCCELKHIIASGSEYGSETSNDIVPAPTNSHFMTLMPSLKKLEIRRCWKLESVFPIWCTEGLTQLQEIAIFMAPKLKYVFGKCDEEAHSCHQYENQIMLPHVEVLTLNDLRNLVGLCPENYHLRWSSQMELRVKCCPKLNM